MLLGIDIGTTHCKAGLFDRDGRLAASATRPMPTRREAGRAFYAPEELWETAAATIRAALDQGSPGAGDLRAIGVASMAESGLLVDRSSGVPRTEVLPWFDSHAAEQATQLARAGTELERFARTGIYPSFKCSLAKLLWVRDHRPEALRGAVWLSAADYVIWRLTGATQTDYSLAGRTYAFRIFDKTWDAEWLESFGLKPDLFPAAAPSGRPAGTVTSEAAAATGLPAGVPAAVAGHDHVCAAFAAGVMEPGEVFDSMGTAETLMGALPEKPLGQRELDSGLSYGCHVVPGRMYWMGGLSTSGGSVEWLRSALAAPELSYAELEALAERAGGQPTGIVYFPYLAGSGAPHSDAGVRAAFAGLSAHHSRAHLARAIFEGTAYEMEYIRQAAEATLGQPVTAIRVAGGGTRSRHWLQIKADVSNCRLEVLPVAEAAMLGAALLAGLGCGVFGSVAEALSGPQSKETQAYWPKAEQHCQYRNLFNHYRRWLAPLRALNRVAA